VGGRDRKRRTRLDTKPRAAQIDRVTVKRLKEFCE
jgi:hypothetical protein